jgi:hypothetical protein
MPCPAQDQCHEVGTCNPATGTCSNPKRPTGSACDDGNACTAPDTCQAGACVGGAAVTCTPGPCQVLAYCDPAIGCYYVAAPDGTACDDGNPCTQVDACTGGTCQGSPAPDGTGCDDGNPCTQIDTCQSGQCTGTNPLADGTACNDGNLCMAGETCQAGACKGTPVVTCTVADQCHRPNTCDPKTGGCLPLADGTDCDDGNGCTLVDACRGGACVGSSPRMCGAVADQCHLPGACDPTTGDCPRVADGTPCDDGDACTQTDACQSGLCVGGNTKVCAAVDDCHGAGTCDPATGTCATPILANGTACALCGSSAGSPGCVAGLCAAGEAVAPPACALAGRQIEEELPLPRVGSQQPPVVTRGPVSALWLNVLDYQQGCSDPSDWSCAFNRALAALSPPTTPANTIFVPHGTYPIKHSIVMHGYGVRIIGEDPATTTLVWAGAPYVPNSFQAAFPEGGLMSPVDEGTRPWMFVVDSVYGGEIRRLTLDGANAGEAAIRQANFSFNVHGSATQNRYSDLVIQNFARGIWGGAWGGSQDDSTHVLRVQFRSIGRAWLPSVGKPLTFLAAVLLVGQNALAWTVQDSTFDRCVTGLDTQGGAAVSINAWNNTFQMSAAADVAMSGNSFFVLRGNTSYRSARFALVNGAALGQVADFDGFVAGGATGRLMATVEDNVILDPEGPAIDIRLFGGYSIVDNVIRSSVSPAILFHGSSGYNSCPSVSLEGNNVVMLGNTFAQPQVGPADSNNWWQAWLNDNQNLSFVPYTPPINGYIALNNGYADLSAHAPPPLQVATPQDMGRAVTDVTTLAAVQTLGPVGNLTSYSVDGPGLSAWIKSNLTANRPVLFFPAGVYKVDGTIVIPCGLDIQIVGDYLSTQVEQTGGDAYVLQLLPPARATLRDFNIVGTMGGAVEIDSVDQAGDQVYVNGSPISGGNPNDGNPHPATDTTAAVEVSGLDHADVRLNHSALTGNNGLRVIGGGAAASGPSQTRGVRVLGASGVGSTNAPFKVASWGKIVTQGFEIESTWGIDLAGGAGYLTMTGTRYFVDPYGPTSTYPAWAALYTTPGQSGMVFLDGFQGSVSLVGMQTGLAFHTSPNDSGYGAYVVASDYVDTVDYVLGLPTPVGVLPYGAPPSTPVNPQINCPTSYGTPPYEQTIDCSPILPLPPNASGAILNVSLTPYVGLPWACMNVTPGLTQSDALIKAYADLRAAKVSTPAASCDPTNMDVVLDRVVLAPMVPVTPGIKPVLRVINAPAAAGQCP